MSFGLRLSLLPLLIAGCASQMLVVPDSDWQMVPAAQRAAIDRQHEADVAAARAEVAAASAGLTALKSSQPTPITPPGGPTAPPALPAPPAPTAARLATASDPAATGGDGKILLRDQDPARAQARAQIEAAKAAWRRADLTWRQLRLDAANERLAMLVYEREFVRAQTIDRNLVGNDTYDVAPLRGQLSRAQQRWHRVASQARQAREALGQASAALASAKEAYADLVRGGPRPPSTEPSIALSDQAPLQLTGWAVSRGDIRRRRGLRHFLDDGTSPQLRGVAVQLKAKRDAQALSLDAATPPAAGLPATARPPTEAPRGNAPVPTAKPFADAPHGNVPIATAKPFADAPRGNAPIATAKPPAEAPRANAPIATAKPMERPAATASPSGTPAIIKPAAEAPRANAP